MVIMKALFDSLVRTLVPLIVANIVGALTGFGLDLDPEFQGSLTAVLTAIFAGVYYIAVRLLETYVTPKFGWLLGLARTPVYVKTEEPIAKTDVIVVQQPADGSAPATATKAE